VGDGQHTLRHGPGRRAFLVVFALALGWGALLAVAIRQPGYTDAYYYFNAAQRWVQGDGLTDAALWVYINAPDSLPGPSHTYWMPLESLVVGVSMWFYGAHFGAAQIPSVLFFSGLVTLAFWIGGRVGENARTAWLSALLVLFSGLFTPFWTTTDTFALYGLAGAGALAVMGLGRANGQVRWFLLGGVLCAFGHLARADGLLLLAVLYLVIWWPHAPWVESRRSWRWRLWLTLVTSTAYFVVMLPWFVRMVDQTGSPLPAAGLQTVWLRGYDELVSYPPNANAADFFAWGAQNILRSRWEALITNLGTFIAVETWVVLGPLVILALWMRRRDPFVLGVVIYGIALHLVMTLVFAYPGYRGGLFHSSAALLPFWASFAVVGLDSAVEWIGRRRRWRVWQARRVFGGAAVVLAAASSMRMAVARIPKLNENGTFYVDWTADLPAEAVVVVNDPPALYYHTGLAGVVVPQADPDVVLELAERYGVTHLLLDHNRTEPFAGLFSGEDQRPFLRLLRHEQGRTDHPADEYRLFEIVTAEKAP